MRRLARGAAAELRASPMRVILAPAPRPHHSGHKIRVVESRPPAWYMEIYRRRWWFKRARFLAALDRISRGDRRWTYYTRMAVELIQRRQAADEGAWAVD